jgi:hypothetical protein
MVSLGKLEKTLMIKIVGGAVVSTAIMFASISMAFAGHIL